MLISKTLEVGWHFQTVVFLKFIQTSDDDTAPHLDTNTVQPVNETINDLFGGTQNTVVLNLIKEPNFTSPINQKIIVESMEFLNAHHRVLNVDRFGAVNSSSVSVVLVVQVGNLRKLELARYLGSQSSCLFVFFD